MQSHLKGLPSMSAHNIMHLLKTNSQKSHLKGFSPVRVRIYAPSNFQSVKTVIDKSHMFLFSASMSKHYVSSHIQLVNTLIYAYIHLTKNRQSTTVSLTLLWVRRCLFKHQFRGNRNPHKWLTKGLSSE